MSEWTDKAQAALQREIAAQDQAFLSWMGTDPDYTAFVKKIRAEDAELRKLTAIQAAQMTVAVDADGVVGPATRSALLRYAPTKKMMVESFGQDVYDAVVASYGPPITRPSSFVPFDNRGTGTASSFRREPVVHQASGTVTVNSGVGESNKRQPTASKPTFEQMQERTSQMTYRLVKARIGWYIWVDMADTAQHHQWQKRYWRIKKEWAHWKGVAQLLREIEKMEQPFTEVFDRTAPTNPIEQAIIDEAAETKRQMQNWDDAFEERSY